MRQLTVIRNTRLEKQLIDPRNNQLVCYRLYDGIYQRIEAQDNLNNAQPLSETLIQSPQYVHFKDAYYDLTLPGVYRFYRLNDVAEQRLVVDGSVEQLLNCMGYLWKYGFEKMVDEKTLAAKKVQNHIFVAGCSDISVIASQILQCYGVTSRIIRFQTLNHLGGQDDSHTLLEVMNEDGDWFVYDPSFLAIFISENKKLTAFDMQQRNIAKDSIKVKLFAGANGPAPFKHSNYDYGFWVEERFHATSALHQWFDAILGVCLYWQGGNQYFAASRLNKEDIDRLKTQGFHPLSDNALKSAFY